MNGEDVYPAELSEELKREIEAKLKEFDAIKVDDPFIGPEQIHMSSGLTRAEKEIMELLVEAWNRFAALGDLSPDHVTDFRHGIHDCQRILATRVVSRMFPRYWR